MNTAKRILFVLLLALLLTLPALAQDATVEPVATQDTVATAEATEVAGGVVINVEAGENTTTTTTDDGVKVVAAIGWIGFLLVLAAFAYVLLLLMRELRKSAAAGDAQAKNLLAFVNSTMNMLPVDEVLKMVDGLDKRAKATPTPGEIDNAVVQTIRATVYEILGRELPGATTGTPAG